MRVKDEAPTAPRLRFTERMRGYFSTQVTRGFRAGWLRGRADGSSIDCTLTIDFEDLRETLEHPDRPARVSGTVDAPRLSPYELTVEDGEFILLERDDQRVETWHMRYRMRLLARDGRHYRLDGLKVLHDRPGFDAWWDTTTLYTTISDGGGSPLGVGIMRIRLADFLRQLRTIRVRNVIEPGRREAYLLAFVWLFARSLLRIYGGPLDEASRFPTLPSGPECDQTRPRRMAPPHPVPGRLEGAGGPRWWLRHVQQLVRHHHDCGEPARVPRRAGLRRLVVRLPGQHRPPLRLRGVHRRRHRHQGLASGRVRGAAGHRRRERPGPRPLRRFREPANGHAGRHARRALGRLRAVHHPPRQLPCQPGQGRAAPHRGAARLRDTAARPEHSVRRPRRPARPGPTGPADALAGTMWPGRLSLDQRRLRLHPPARPAQRCDASGAEPHVRGRQHQVAGASRADDQAGPGGRPPWPGRLPPPPGAAATAHPAPPGRAELHLLSGGQRADAALAAERLRPVAVHARGPPRLCPPRRRRGPGRGPRRLPADPGAPRRDGLTLPRRDRGPGRRRQAPSRARAWIAWSPSSPAIPSAPSCRWWARSRSAGPSLVTRTSA